MRGIEKLCCETDQSILNIDFERHLGDVVLSFCSASKHSSGQETTRRPSLWLLLSSKAVVLLFYFAVYSSTLTPVFCRSVANYKLDGYTGVNSISLSYKYGSCHVPVQQKL